MRFTINLLAVFTILILIAPLSLTAAALSETSPSIDVLDLPEPEITKIDSKGIVHMTISIDPEARADFRASVTVSDSNGNVLETSPQVVVDNPGDVKVPVQMDLISGYRITPEISNNNFKSTGTEGVHSGGSSEPSGPQVIYDIRTRTKYVVTEVSGDQVVIEKIVEVETPAPTIIVEYGINGLGDVEVPAETPIREIIADDPEMIEEIAEVLMPSPIQVSDKSQDKIAINTKVIVFIIVAMLGATLFAVNMYLGRVTRASIGEAN